MNLKERIAALQQRNVAIHQRQSSTSHGSNTHASGLRDKIAQFEQKGGVPVPRGSFGLGAPPVAGAGQPRRTGELYGNRIPLVLRSASGTSFSRSSSPLLSGSFTPTGRSRSPSVDGEALTPDHSPSFTGLPSSPSSPVLLSLPHSPTSLKRRDSLPAASPTTSPRKEYFTKALRVARRNSMAFESPRKHGNSPEPSHTEPPDSLAAKPLSQPVFLSDSDKHAERIMSDDITNLCAAAASTSASLEISQNASVSETSDELGSTGGLDHEEPELDHGAEEPSQHVPDAEPSTEGTPEGPAALAVTQSNISITPAPSPIIQLFTLSDEDTMVPPSGHAPRIHLIPSPEVEIPAMLTPQITIAPDDTGKPHVSTSREVIGGVVKVVGQDEIGTATSRIPIAIEQKSHAPKSPKSASVRVSIPVIDVFDSTESSTAQSSLIITPTLEVTSDSEEW